MVNNIGNLIRTSAVTTAKNSENMTAIKTSQLQGSNSVFARDTLSLGNTFAEYSTYTANPSSEKYASYTSLADYVNGMSVDEVRAKLAEMRLERTSLDYTGMTDIEIYESIYNRYAEAFGEDFCAVQALKISNGSAYGGPYSGFQKELLNQFGSFDKIYAVNRERLYSGMGPSEVQDAIIAKYPANLTNRDLCLMIHEMSSAGLGGSGFTSLFWASEGYKSSLCSNGETWSREAAARWEAMLEEPVSAPHFQYAFNGMKSANTGAGIDFIETFISRLFNVYTNSEGFFDIDNLFTNNS